VTSILPLAKTQFSDSQGVPLAGGSVGYYVPATLTPKQTWQDAAQSVPNTTPIVTLDGAGEALIWGSGAYRQIVKDSVGNLIWDQVVQDASLAFGTPAANLVLAGPGSGPAAAPTFRALVDADLPSIFSSIKSMSGAAFNEAYLSSAITPSGGVLDISGLAANFIDISANAMGSITGFGALPQGAERTLRFTGAAPGTLTNAGTLVLPGTTSITLRQFDIAKLRSFGSSTCELVSYLPYTGPAIYGKASAATAFTGTDDLQFLTAAGFAGNLSSGANGYYKLPGGLIVQWGTLSLPGGGAVTGSFPIAFPTGCYQMVASFTVNGNAAAGTLICLPISASQYTATDPSATAGAVSFIAIGH